MRRLAMPLGRGAEASFQVGDTSILQAKEFVEGLSLGVRCGDQAFVQFTLLPESHARFTRASGVGFHRTLSLAESLPTFEGRSNMGLP